MIGRVMVLLAAAGAASDTRAADTVRITENLYQDRPHFVVKTPQGTWWFDRAGGGFSRLLDADGQDWIGFKKDPLKTFPDSAAAGYRGLPNCVFGGPDAGAGHPGFDQCISEQVGSDQIVTTTKSGRWRWTWNFTPTHARFHMERTPGNHPWWFLYEGTPAGQFAPREIVWGTDAGPQQAAPDFLASQELTGSWRWVYFTRKTASQMLVVGRCQPDAFPDLCGFMGSTRAGLDAPEGMVVLGLGRGPKSAPKFYSAGKEFVVALLPTKPDADPAARARHIHDQFPELTSTSTFPGRDWETARPEEVGLDAAQLTAAVEYLKSATPRDGVRKLAIVRRGRLVWHGDDIDTMQGVWSCTKGFTSTALGLLVADGKCTLDTPVAGLVPALAADYPAVTFRHLTTMTSGYRAVGDDPTPDGYAHGPSRTPFVPGEPMFRTGEHYAYWDSAMNVLGLALTRQAGEPLEELVRRRVLDPIGVPAASWRWGRIATDDDTKLIINGGSGNNDGQVQTTARQLARFGHLYLNHGFWNGQRVLAPEWVAAATGVRVPATFADAFPRSRLDGVGVHGFNWWVNGERRDGKRLWPDAPPATFAARGYNNNRLWVVPEWELVVVRLGLDQNEKLLDDAITNEFLKRMGEALTDRSP